MAKSEIQWYGTIRVSKLEVINEGLQKVIRYSQFSNVRGHTRVAPIARGRKIGPSLNILVDAIAGVFIDARKLHIYIRWERVLV